MEPSLARFGCRIQLEPDGLRIGYVVQNTADVDMGTFNHVEVPDPKGIPTIRPENAYIDLQGTTLRVQKLALPIPEGLTMTAHPLPHVTRLPPGRSFKEDFLLHFPIRVYNPFLRAQLAAASPHSTIVADYPRPANTVTFYLGVFRIAPDTKFVPVSGELPDVYRVWPPGPNVDNQVVLFETKPLTAPISVFDYGAVPRELIR